MFLKFSCMEWWDAVPTLWWWTGRGQRNTSTGCGRSPSIHTECIHHARYYYLLIFGFYIIIIIIFTWMYLIQSPYLPNHHFAATRNRRRWLKNNYRHIQMTGNMECSNQSLVLVSLGVMPAVNFYLFLYSDDSLTTILFLRRCHVM